jgi:hypothetical protein
MQARCLLPRSVADGTALIAPTITRIRLLSVDVVSQFCGDRLSIAWMLPSDSLRVGCRGAAAR